MNGLPDPIAGKGYANILPALKVPEFGEIASMQTANNQLALNAAKLAADQKAKADALALAQAKAQKEAADRAKADRNKQDVALYSLLATKPLFQLPVAQEYFADRHYQIEIEARGYLDKGGTIYDKEFLPIKKKLQEYEADYLAEHENAKALTTKQETYNKNPMGFNEYDPVKDYSQNYVTHIEKKKKGEMSQFFPTSLEQYVPPTSEEVLSKRLLTDVQYGEVEKTDTKHPRSLGSNVIYTTSKVAAPVVGSEDYVKAKVNYLQSTPNLNKDQIADKKGLEVMAGQYGALNQDGTIDADKFAAEIVRRNTPATTYGERTANIDKPNRESGSGDNTNFNFKNLGDGRYDIGNTKNVFVIKEGSIPLNTSLDTEDGESTFFGATNKMLKVPVIPSAGVTDLGYNFDPNEVDISNITQIDENGNQIAVKKQPEFSTAQRAIVRYLPKRQDGQYGASVLDESGKHDVQSGDVVDYEASYFVKDKTGNRYIIPAVKATPTMKTYIRIPKNEVDVMFGGQQVQQTQTPPTTQEIPAGMKSKGKPKKQF